ncbi:hypothetical protein [Arthrobacter sp. B6]|uniref:hypothetical protein n=1 Tax=Arthrobacter sp. B6 TaxID=1570137 RepID=UPI000A8AD89D|nr:hypothetical protein [Arthrobacter sp. B6]
MTEHDIAPYLNWTKNMLRNEERPVVSRMLGIREWTVLQRNGCSRRQVFAVGA